MERHVAEKSIQNFGLKTQWKKLLAKTRHRWENNYKMNHEEIVHEDGLGSSGLFIPKYLCGNQLYKVK